MFSLDAWSDLIFQYTENHVTGGLSKVNTASRFYPMHLPRSWQGTTPIDVIAQTYEALCVIVI